MKTRKNAGITLMELLVAVGLMVLLMTAIVMIFFRSTDVMKIGDARINIYENARAALDTVANDLQNGLSYDGGQQRLQLQQFVRPAAGGVAAGSNTDGAMDTIGIMTVATVPPTPGGLTREVRTVYVEYFLAPDEDAETSANGTGSTIALRSSRQIFVLKRRVWAVIGNTGLVKLTTQLKGAVSVPLFGTAYPIVPPYVPQVAGFGSAPDLVLLEEGDLCHWVVSFNVEVYWDDTPTDPSQPGRWDELSAPAPNPYLKAIMPVGDVVPPQPVGVVVDPTIPRKFRLTMRVIEGAAERQERIFQREVWAPLGG